MNEICVTCPHCNGTRIIIEANCCIFRDAVYISGEQISPHTPKHICDELTERGDIYGCGKPFKIVKTEDGWKTEKCDYI